jgi:hypothetical protein
MNTGDQKDKFITIYVKPVMYSVLALVNRLDPLLVEMEATSGPRAMNRISRAYMNAGITDLKITRASDFYHERRQSLVQAPYSPLLHNIASIFP